MESERASFGLVGLARLHWVMYGPMILLLLLLGVATKGGGWFTLLDVAFIVVLATVMFARWYEFRGGNSVTGTGEPATPTHLRNYLVGAVLIGLGTWIVANLIGNPWQEG